ncbi:MAG: hypothetical protein H6605_09325 [Flavobacteriales bacterium]|nr:hypothetical protein [Flavobacteriales bacterium]
MISYSPKHWMLFIFKVHKAETFRELYPVMILLAVYSFMIDFIFINHLHLDTKSKISGLSIMYSVLGFVISLLLAFRTNTAYERWWEGRKLWGALVNCSRNLAILLKTETSEGNHEFYKKQIPVYAKSLKAHLQEDSTYKPENVDKDTVHVPNAVAKAVWTRIGREKINETQLLLLSKEWKQWTEICGACERIKNTPIPYSYSSFLKKFLFFYTMFMPFVYVGALHYYIVPLVVFIFYVLASLELIAEEIENPFGTDTNDLPLDKLVNVIEVSVNEIFEKN